MHLQDEEETEPEFIAEEELEESDLSDLEDWTSLRTDEGEVSSVLEESEEEEAERVVLGRKRTRNPHVEIEYETELEARTKLKT